MELDPAIVKKQLSICVPSRYVEPTNVRFWSNGGPYSRCHLYDNILQQDVEYCSERLYQVDGFKSETCSQSFETAMHYRKRFLMEAQIGQLKLPHIPSTFDFGWMPTQDARELFYFTRPLSGSSLAEEFRWPLLAAKTLALLDMLESESEFLVSEECFASYRQFHLNGISKSMKDGWILECKEPTLADPQQIVLPSEKEKRNRLRMMEDEIERISNDTVRDFTEEQKARLRDDAKRCALQDLLKLVKLPSHWPGAGVGIGERWVQLNFRKFVDCLLTACNAIEQAHGNDLLHLGLSPVNGIQSGLDDGRIYIADWYWSHVKGAPWQPSCRISTTELAPSKVRLFEEEWTGELPNCRTDVAMLGHILSFLIHDHQAKEFSVNAKQLRKIYHPWQSEGDWGGLYETMRRLEKVAAKAVNFRPEDRHASAAELAAEITDCLTARTYAATEPAPQSQPHFRFQPFPLLFPTGSADSDCLRISLANAEEIRSWSSGEVTQAHMFDPLDGSPIEGGLYCESIFGTTHDWKCQCGKLTGEPQRNRLCLVCDHFPSFRSAPQTRMGHIELAMPVVHPLLYLGKKRSLLSVLLDLKDCDVTRLVRSRVSMVVDPGTSSLKDNQILTTEECIASQQDCSDRGIVLMTGALAIDQMLTDLDLGKVSECLKTELLTVLQSRQRTKIQRRLALIEDIVKANTCPRDMILCVLPVMSPESRRKNADIDTLYRRTLVYNQKLRELITTAASEEVVRKAHRRLQRVVDSLFDNANRDKPMRDKRSGRVLSSISSRLRVHSDKVLQKRVDYSARSVAVPGPGLKPHQCGLPKLMAMELFRPFVERAMIDRGHAKSRTLARKLVARRTNDAWDALASIMETHRVILCKPDVLNRSRLLSFEPVLIEGKAIQLNPLSAAHWNFNYDGEEVMVHLPLSTDAQEEARWLLNAASTGFPEKQEIPTDLSAGLHYLTLALPNQKGEGMGFGSMEQAITAWEHGQVALHAKVTLRIGSRAMAKPMMSEWHASFSTSGRIETTMGRILLNELLPEAAPFYDAHIDERNLRTLLNECGVLLTVREFNELVCCLMRRAAHHLTSSGVSISIGDLAPPESKESIVAQAEKRVEKFNKHYTRGLICPTERYHQTIDAWQDANESIAKDILTKLDSENHDPFTGLNIVPLMLRGHWPNLRQLCSMVGTTMLNEKLCEYPITSSFAEGLGSSEYFRLVFGASIERRSRKRFTPKPTEIAALGLSLIQLLRSSWVSIEDCGTTKGIAKSESAVSAFNDDLVTTLPPIANQVVDRVSLHEVKSPHSGELCVAANELMTAAKCSKFRRLEINRILVRSVLTCESPVGICQNCIGGDHYAKRMMEIGSSLGTNSALAWIDAIGQLTDPERRFPVYRIFGLGMQKPEYRYVEDNHTLRAQNSGRVAYDNLRVSVNEDSSYTVLNDGGELTVVDSTGLVLESHRLQAGTKVIVRDGRFVLQRTALAAVGLATRQVVAETAGYAGFDCTLPNGDVRNRRNLKGHLIRRRDMFWNPRITVCDDKGLPNETHYIEPGFRILVDVGDRDTRGQKVAAGDVLAEATSRPVTHRDMEAVGFERLVELLHLLRPRNPATLAPVSGIVEAIPTRRERSPQIHIRSMDGVFHAVSVRRERVYCVAPGDRVRVGDRLVNGTLVPKEIYRYLGIEAAQQYLVTEIEHVFRDKSISIDGRHIELLVSQMFRNVKILDSGDSQLLPGAIVSRYELQSVNRRLRSAGSTRLASGELLLQSIGAAGRTTESQLMSALSGKSIGRRLAKAAIQGQSDQMTTLRANELTGRLINVGTERSSRQTGDHL